MEDLYIQIKNDYHNTHIRAIAKNGRLTKTQVYHIRKTLCGIDGCTCGGNLSERGKQIQENGSVLENIPCSDGSILVALAKA